MNIKRTRTTSIALSATELVAALKLAYPTNLEIQALPSLPAALLVTMPTTGVIQIVAKREEGAQ